jgi:1-acyl-sn-glycerol-3-phosphate acyltransferase/3-hydroxymyristoyl/3-hydroxydecanoyl-(acyl carrier protein) dehydratase
MRNPESIADRCQQLFWCACFYAFLLLFAAGAWVANTVSFLLAPLLPRAAARRTLRVVIDFMMRFYVSVMEFSGALRTNRQVLDGLARTKGGLLIVANHPGMVDAPIILSRIPGLTCVFKSALKHGLLLPSTARMAGYLSNDDGLQMLRALTAELRAGGRVLLFPEGTRTSEPVLNRLNAGYALAALRARVPVQVIAIRAESPVLTKKQHFLRAARFPARFELLPGPVIEPGDFNTVKQLNRYVDGWLRQRLTGPWPAPPQYLPANARVAPGAGQIEADLRVPADPFYCRGHMPESPLVPAYVQLAWVREIMTAAMPAPAAAITYRRWKFLQPVRPGAVLRFHARRQDNTWLCAFASGPDTCSHGRVVLGAAAEDAAS